MKNRQSWSAQQQKIPHSIFFSVALCLVTGTSLYPTTRYSGWIGRRIILMRGDLLCEQQVSNLPGAIFQFINSRNESLALLDSYSLTDKDITYLSKVYVAVLQETQNDNLEAWMYYALNMSQLFFSYFWGWCMTAWKSYMDYSHH